MKNKLFLVLVIVNTLFLASCTNNKNDKICSKATKTIEKKAQHVKKDDTDYLSFFNKLATNSKDSGVINIDKYKYGVLYCGENQQVVPGIYDLTVIKGQGNISGDKKIGSDTFNNWEAVGGADGEVDRTGATIFRVILTDGDDLVFDNTIHEVQFRPVPVNIVPTKSIGIGEYIVGRDILPGKYRLKTNVPFYGGSSSWDEWLVSVYNQNQKKDVDNQRLMAGDKEADIDLKDGEIVTTSLNLTSAGFNADDARLYFNMV